MENYDNIFVIQKNRERDLEEEIRLLKENVSNLELLNFRENMDHVKILQETSDWLMDEKEAIHLEYYNYSRLTWSESYTTEEIINRLL